MGGMCVPLLTTVTFCPHGVPSPANADTLHILLGTGRGVCCAMCIKAERCEAGKASTGERVA